MLPSSAKASAHKGCDGAMGTNHKATRKTPRSTDMPRTIAPPTYAVKRSRVRQRGGSSTENQVAGDLGLDQRRRACWRRRSRHRHHHQAGDQKRGVRDASVEHRDARFEHVRKNQQVQQRREHRRQDGLKAHFPEPQELLVQKRPPARAVVDRRAVNVGFHAARFMILRKTCSRSASCSASSVIATSSVRNDDSRPSSSA